MQREVLVPWFWVVQRLGVQGPQYLESPKLPAVIVPTSLKSDRLSPKPETLYPSKSVGAKHPQAVPSDHAELDPMSCPTRIDAVTEKPWQCESFQLPSNEQCKLQLTVHEPLYGSGLSVAALMYFVPLFWSLPHIHIPKLLINTPP